MNVWVVVRTDSESMRDLYIRVCESKQAAKKFMRAVFPSFKIDYEHCQADKLCYQNQGGDFMFAIKQEVEEYAGERDYKKLKELDDWSTLDAPLGVNLLYKDWDSNGYTVKSLDDPILPKQDIQVLRMLVKPKYGQLQVPTSMAWLKDSIKALVAKDKEITGIKDSWVYVTVRKGIPHNDTDAWHFDGGSLRTELIPERNYIWVDSYPTQYKLGGVDFPDDFNPLEHDMFSFAQEALKDEPIGKIEREKWFMFSPFVFHRRDPMSDGRCRTFIRVSFVDIEVRDVKCTPNPCIEVESFGRDPVEAFRKKLKKYKKTDFRNSDEEKVYNIVNWAGHPCNVKYVAKRFFGDGPQQEHYNSISGVLSDLEERGLLKVVTGGYVCVC